MELWEGAILAIGGIWLVGTLARRSANSPINKVATSISAVGTTSSAGNTISTNTDGSHSLIAGEPLSGGAPPLPVKKVVSVASPYSSVAKAPIAVANPLRSIVGKPAQRIDL